MIIVPNTENTLQAIKEQIYTYARDHQSDFVESEKTDEEKLLILLHHVLTREHIARLATEELAFVKKQENAYRNAHPNFSPITAAVNLATKFFNESPDETNVTISMMSDGNEIKPHVGIHDNAKAWYRFTRNDIDYYIERVDYYKDYIELLEYVQETVMKETIQEEDKELIGSFLAERRDYWEAKEDEKALQKQDIAEEQLNKGIYQALITTAMEIETEEVQD